MTTRRYICRGIFGYTLEKTKPARFECALTSPTSYRTKSSPTILTRVSASAHNCAAIVVGSLPLLPLLGKENWRYALVAICFAYHYGCRRRCLGNFICGLTNPK